MKRRRPVAAALPTELVETQARYLHQSGAAAYLDRYGPPPPEVERAARALHQAARRTRLLDELDVPAELRSPAARGRS